MKVCEVTSSTAKLECGVWVVDKNLFRSNFAVNFWNFQKFPRRSEATRCYAEVATN